MGTSIKCFFARGALTNPADVQAALNVVMAERSEDVRLLATRGRFSTGGEDWRVHQARPADGEPGYVTGEGPAGLAVDVYPRVVIVGSAERFHALYDDRGTGIAGALHRLLGTFARRLGRSSLVAVAAGGFGDSDRAADVAYYEGGSFEDVCAVLAEVAGPAARTWDELAGGEYGWFLGEPWDPE